MTSIDAVLARVREQLHLERDTENEIVAEIRAHLEDAVAQARRQGLSEADALTEAAADFGVEDVAVELQTTHAGWGTADGILLAGLPVLCALVLRWLMFAPDGTALGWEELLVRPALWVMAAIALVIPWLHFRRWRYALLMWTFFWGITVLLLVFPSHHW